MIPLSTVKSILIGALLSVVLVFALTVLAEHAHFYWISVVAVFLVFLFFLGPRTFRGWFISEADILEINRQVFEGKNEHAKDMVRMFWFGSTAVKNGSLNK
jgi:hypothetical protein